MQAVLDEILKKTVRFTEEEYRELINLLQEQRIEKQRVKRAKQPKTSVRKDFVLHPNTIWMKENSKNYRGKHIALENGELIATGRTIKEANEKAKAKGVSKPMLHYISAEDEENWGGW